MSNHGFGEYLVSFTIHASGEYTVKPKWGDWNSCHTSAGIKQPGAN